MGMKKYLPQPLRLRENLSAISYLTAAIRASKLSVTVEPAVVEEAFATDTDGDWTPDADNAMFDGYYHESYFQSAPAFGLRIDGITELNNN